MDVANGDGMNQPALKPLLQLQQLRVCRGGREVLHGLDLKVMPGERIALIGPNGGGKTTLLRALHGWGPSVANQRTGLHTDQIGMLFQKPYVLRTRALWQVALGAWLQGKTWELAKQDALLALAAVGLSDLAHRSATQLSGGQQQRLALARAWVRQPRLLLLDEPTANLDPQARAELEALLLRWTESAAAPGGDAGGPESALSLVFSSHQMAQVRRLATRVVYVTQGRIQADLPVAQFFDLACLQAVSPEAAQFLKQETL